MLQTWTNMQSRSFQSIEANYEKYTETERYIADYFLKAGKTGAAVGRTSVKRAFRFRGVAVTFCQKNVVLAVTGSSRMNFVIPMWRKSAVGQAAVADWF